MDEEVPTYDVIFPDGHEDTLMLQHFVARPKAILSKKACNFIGNLKNDPIATVAVTGCYGEETVTFSINSKHSFYTNIFELDINGNVHGIEIPYNLPSPLVIFCNFSNELKYVRVFMKIRIVLCCNHKSKQTYRFLMNQCKM